MRLPWLILALVVSAGCLSREGGQHPATEGAEGGDPGWDRLETVDPVNPPPQRPGPVSGSEALRAWNGTVGLRGDWVAVCAGPGPPLTWNTMEMETRSAEVDLDIANVTGIDLTATWAPDDPSAAVLSINLVPPGGAGPDLRRDFPYRSGASPLTWRIEDPVLDRMGDPTQVRALFDRDCDAAGAWTARSGGVEVRVEILVEYADGSSRMRVVEPA